MSETKTELQPKKEILEMISRNHEVIINDNPQNLIALAIEKGAGIEQLEKLMALKERYDAIEANKSFIAALSTFQRDVPVIEKKKTVSYPSKNGGVTVAYKYAELPEIDEAIKVPMAANGFSKRWEFHEDAEKLICSCIISHVSGHKEVTTMSSLKDASGGKNEIQSRASANTYMQRYTLVGALGLTTASEDNDGDGTADAKPQAQQKQFADDPRPWLSEENYKKAIEAIHRGEKGILEALQTEFKMSKAYRADLEKATANPGKAAITDLPWLNKGTKQFTGAVEKLIAGTTTIDKIKTVMRLSPATETDLLFEVDKQKAAIMEHQPE